MFKETTIKQTRTIGEKLKQERLATGFKLETIAKEINISKDYLMLIEEGDFEELPGEVYIINFLRIYATFLKLDYKKILDEYEIEKNIHQLMKKEKNKIFKKNSENTKTQWYSIITASLIKKTIVILVVLSSLLFLWSKVNNIIAPPFLKIINPKNSFTTSDNQLEILGQTEVGARILINGQDVMVNTDGIFLEKINLQSGLNTIKISAIKKYSKTIDVFREVIVKK